MSVGTIKKVVEQVLEEREEELDNIANEIASLRKQVNRNVEILQMVINEVFGEGANPEEPSTWDEDSVASYAWILGAMDTELFSLDKKDILFLQALREKHERT